MISLSFILKFIVAAVGAGTPLLFGTVGEIMSEKVGHLNLGVEGMMAIGAVAGFAAGYMTGNLAAAMIAAFLAGVLAALIYAVLTVGFMANQNVIGLTLTIFGVGLSNFIGVYMVSRTGGSNWQLPAISPCCRTFPCWASSCSTMTPSPMWVLSSPCCAAGTCSAPRPA